MAKKIRPSLKDYLRTGVVRLTEDRESDAFAENQGHPSAPTSPPGLSESLLALLSERDRHTWEPILKAGTEIRSAPLDFVALREEFRTADRNRFTYYLLADEEEHLRPIRTSVQIREPAQMLLKWDETGVLTFYSRHTTGTG